MYKTIRLLGKSSSSSRWLSRHSKDPYVLKRSSSDENYRSRSSFKLLSLITRYPLFGQGSNVVDLGAAPGGWSQVAVKYVFNKQKQDQKVADNKVEQHNVMREKERRKRGSVFALDILPMEPIPDVDIITGDFLDDNVRIELFKRLRNSKINSSSREVGEARTLDKEVLPSMYKDIELGEIGNVEEKDELLLDCVLSDMMAPMSGIRIRDIQASLDLVRGATQFAKTVLRSSPSSSHSSHSPLTNPSDPNASTTVLRSPGGSTPSSISGTLDTSSNTQTKSLGHGQTSSAGARPNGKRPRKSSGGNLVMKFFSHPDLDDFKRQELIPFFDKVFVDKPKESRKGASSSPLSISS
ncbi:hypothetical protein M231_05536 [Tremella mesenterica]|uniref:rRNA methyltransferase 2, mitochondrial n=1 Tax=Tremella mesenterica TaxID=5217 RepID=A0A4V1M3K3_TREME|nr:hypothetical protein M231_05536 [Tremella mesenterica]